MGFVTLGIFTITQQGIEGSIVQMISHGLVSAALFLCVGVVYDRMHSRLIATYGGLVSIMPKYSILFMLFTLAAAKVKSINNIEYFGIIETKPPYVAINLECIRS